jgi:hypothetical protein
VVKFDVFVAVELKDMKRAIRAIGVAAFLTLMGSIAVLAYFIQNGQPKDELHKYPVYPYQRYSRPPVTVYLTAQDKHVVDVTWISVASSFAIACGAALTVRRIEKKEQQNGRAQ